MLTALASASYLHLHDPYRLHRFVNACFVVMRTNPTWTELGCLVLSAGAAKRRFRSWAKKGTFYRLIASSQPVAGPEMLQIDSIAIRCHRMATGARHPVENLFSRLKDFRRLSLRLAPWTLHVGVAPGADA